MGSYIPRRARIAESLSTVATVMLAGKKSKLYGTLSTCVCIFPHRRFSNFLLRRGKVASECHDVVQCVWIRDSRYGSLPSLAGKCMQCVSKWSNSVLIDASSKSWAGGRSFSLWAVAVVFIETDGLAKRVFDHTNSRQRHWRPIDG